jgi:signal transduction histidine kinase
VVRFSQVLRNVLANAMKFSPDGGVIHITVEETVMTRGTRAADLDSPVAAWRILVIDEGIGIPEDELETVFDSFVQSSKTRTGAGGTGLGLTICREIVAAHRGSISARNSAQGGAVFEILVPR